MKIKRKTGRAEEDAENLEIYEHPLFIEGLVKNKECRKGKNILPS